jgi:hypothetical protein
MAVVSSPKGGFVNSLADYIRMLYNHTEVAVVLKYSSPEPWTRCDIPWAFEKFWLCFTKEPPLSYSFEGSQFYIRPCYKVYYDLIIACLESGKIEALGAHVHRDGWSSETGVRWLPILADDNLSKHEIYGHQTCR